MAFYKLEDSSGVRVKIKNFGHHAEYLESGLGITDLEKMIKDKRAVYDYSADMRKNKWSGKKKLKKTDLSELPQFLQLNYDKFKNWFC